MPITVLLALLDLIGINLHAIVLVLQRLIFKQPSKIVLTVMLIAKVVLGLHRCALYAKP
jgi:hypothetical protein